MQRELRLLALAGVVTSKFFLIVGHSKIGCRTEEKKKNKQETYAFNGENEAKNRS